MKRAAWLAIFLAIGGSAARADEDPGVTPPAVNPPPLLVAPVPDGGPLPVQARDPSLLVDPSRQPPPPPGFHLARRPRWRLVINGSIFFGAGWTPALVLAGFGLAQKPPAGEAAAIAIPVASPIWAGVRQLGAGESYLFGNAVNIMVAALCFADAAVQVTGLALIIAGAVGQPELVRDEPRVHLVPLLGPTAAGLAIAGSFD